MKQPKTYKGKVIFFDDEKGYGTIKSGTKEIYFEYEQLPIEDGEFKIPEIGQNVEFQIFRTEFGIAAKNIDFI